MMEDKEKNTRMIRVPNLFSVENLCFIFKFFVDYLKDNLVILMV